MIKLGGIKKTFGEKKVLKGVSLEIPKGESHAIIGKSGCGKSVLLKIIVALIKPDEGSVEIDGEEIFSLSKKNLNKIRNKFGFLFQSAALFDSLSVAENVALPLVENEIYNFTTSEIAKLVSEKLEIVGLSGTENLKPSELSGGMQKRVGLARALITEPEYILYDEPTTGLDPVMSDAIDKLIKELNETFNVTTIVVTHDLLSVKNIASKVSMLNDGIIYFTGTFDEIINNTDKTIEKFVKRTFDYEN